MDADLSGGCDGAETKVEGSAVVYAPFGEVRAGELSMLTDLGFTGQRLDRSAGELMYYGARYYLPSLRRFIAADTVVPGHEPSQALNRYSYVLNNPLKLVDPTGHLPWAPCIEGIICSPNTKPSFPTPAPSPTIPSPEPDPAPEPAPTPPNVPGVSVETTVSSTTSGIVESIQAAIAQCNGGDLGYCIGEVIERAWLSFWYPASTSYKPPSATSAFEVDKSLALAMCQTTPLFCTLDGGRPLQPDMLIGIVVPPLPAPIASRGGIWTSTSTLSPAENALRHWNRHRGDFPQLNNALEYQRTATEFINNPPTGAYVGTRSWNGDIVVYDPSTDVYAAGTVDGTPRTMFRPTPGSGHGYSSNLEYFFAHITDLLGH